MSNHTRDSYVRTDMWREGSWLDLWSVVHFLSGICVAFGLAFFHFGANATVVIALLLLIAYEMFEVIAKIDETVTNRIMDVVVGMISFTPVFLFVIPHLTRNQFYEFFIPILALDIFLSVIGWRESQKASELQKKVRSELEKERERMRLRTERRREKRRLNRDGATTPSDLNKRQY
ncbi:MAG: hypothetical protein JWO50_142 [Candidatus Kaiserbacteria bacterium]|nr:hypothetical protein [Candidatus Kaiserbacteria bacterium]